jgi:Ran GTPase-activating protein (RanGAP) involved in mRNA processing and transport
MSFFLISFIEHLVYCGHNTLEFMPSTKSALRARVVRCRSRAKLDLSEQHVTDEDVPFIALEAIVKRGCKDLCLRSNEITQEGVPYLADALQYNSGLETLSLSSNRIGDQGALRLSSSLMANMSQVKELDLSDTGITDEGINCLAEMLQRNTCLTHLWLDNNYIGNPGIKTLTDAIDGRSNLSVKNISLSGNKSVTEASIEDLIEMIDEWRLKTLHLRYCGISEGGKQQLRKTLTSKRSSLILFI